MNKRPEEPLYYLSAKEVSRYLSVPLRTVQRLSKEGKIKAIKIGNKWRYSKDDITRYKAYGTDFSREPSRRPDSFIERRAYPRINCNFKCRYSVNIPPFKNISNSGIIKNIGAGGVLLICGDRAINTGDPIDLEFMEIRTAGRVVRSDRGGVGIKFRNISEGDRERIIKYVG